MELKKLLAMKLGDETAISTTIDKWYVLRVPGGWIYQSTCTPPIHTFVPEPMFLNPEKIVTHDMEGK